ncbi:glycine cleavage system protein GcvH [Rhodovarius crocodyli]|uniref:Glycine cleavage system H protein n=1 Tax=Rhodovarius crocodyli TaxID=1979269 RepID=A0A437M3N8_9PROT|nr:glycine cleavage system protein GcvH [Rhodovarius crocodyli]RVT92317.1 glycine cleavage system protein GcvH [Rhodovarius crocodyli]
MAEMKFSKDHEWIRVEGGVATVGITDHAQTALGDVVFVELPDVGRDVTPGEAVAVVESVKAASDVYAPVAGKVVAVNDALVDNPGTINAEPTGEGWFFKVELSGGLPDDLLDEAGYQAFVDSL